MKKQTLPRGRVFVCTNEKAPEKDQCDKDEGEKCAAWIKEEINKRNLKGKIRVTRTKCLGYCERQGTAIVFEPMHEQYSSVRFEDVPRLFEDFLSKLRLSTTT